MATNQGRGRAPDARVFVVAKTTERDDRGELVRDADGNVIEKWTEISAAWKTQNGGFAFELGVVPVAMLGGQPVRIVLTLRDPNASQQSNQQRGGRR